MTTPAPLLDLTTIDPVERPYILIDGERFDFKVPGDFGLLELNRLDRMAAQVRTMTPQADAMLSDADTELLTKTLNVVCREILRPPRGDVAAFGLIDKLTDVKRLAILASFMPASRDETAGPAKRRSPRRRPTGARSSRSSLASTARRPG